MKNLIFAIGPAWNNLNVLLKTIKTNKTILPNITKIYIPTNDRIVEKYFQDNPQKDIVCKFFSPNQGHQLSCFNCIISAMHMILEDKPLVARRGGGVRGQSPPADDIVIFSHEDCYVKNIDLFNNALNKLNNYEIVCREFNAPVVKNHYNKYYGTDTFFIKKSVISKYFAKTKILNEFYDFGKKPTNYMQFHTKNTKFCEAHFTKIIQKAKIYSFLYAKTHRTLTPDRFLETLGTHKNTELGFYHIP